MPLPRTAEVPSLRTKLGALVSHRFHASGPQRLQLGLATATRDGSSGTESSADAGDDCTADHVDGNRRPSLMTTRSQTLRPWLLTMRRRTLAPASSSLQSRLSK